mmetsp:Transcript_21462/g.34932  ORF Transcript_21462/g.34932 Transcript_21462/m.34932 type:complete len:492 (-) Transcript_21462:3-1478(-)
MGFASKMQPPLVYHGFGFVCFIVSLFRSSNHETIYPTRMMFFTTVVALACLVIVEAKHKKYNNYLAIGDSTASGEGLGFGVFRNHSWRSLNAATAQKITLSKDEIFHLTALSVKVKLGKVSMADLKKWVHPCDDFEHDMPIEYLVLNSLMYRIVTNLGDNLCHAATYWKRPKSPKGNWENDSCHRSKDSYPFLVAKKIRPHKFESKACTGAAIDDGILRPEINLSPKPDPNFPQIDAVFNKTPDLITLAVGANDIGFMGPVMYCGISTMAKTWYGKLQAAFSHSLTWLLVGPLFTAMVDIVLAEAFNVKRGQLGSWKSGDCTLERPGPVLQDAFDKLPKIQENLETVIGKLQYSRRDVTVLVQNYFNPMPVTSKPDFQQCPDFLVFNQQHFEAFHHAFTTLNSIIENAVYKAKSRNVRLIDVAKKFKGHEYCSRKGSWTVGFSFVLQVLYKDFFKDSTGVGNFGLGITCFHPTHLGQKRMKDAVLQALHKK